ncbi:MAG TPA: hypothetical protein VGL91_07785 [Acidobacteriota bacterium]|jgi:hypothetical protein
MKRLLRSLIAFVCLVFASAAASAQTERAEYDGLIKIQQEPSIDTRIQLGEDFLQKYPNSTYGPYVRQQLVYAYNQKKNPDKVIEHGEGAKSVKDVNVLTLLAIAYGDKKINDKSLQTAQAALEVLNGPEAPSNLTPEQKNQSLSLNQYLVGTAYYRQAKENQGSEKNALLGKAKESLEAAIHSNPKNDFAYYQLGLTLAEMSQGTAACEALAKAVVLEGPAKPIAQQDLEKIYIYYNRKPKAAAAKDLDKLLAKAKADLK